MEELNKKIPSFKINYDGCITQIPKGENITPLRGFEFIPVSTIRLSGNRHLLFLFIPLFLALLFFGLGGAASMITIGISQYEENSLLHIVGGITLGCFVLLFDYFLGKYVNHNIIHFKKKIFREVDFIQSNYKSNDYPLIMTDNKIGIYAKKIKKVIVPPKYEAIQWVVPATVISATLNDEKIFFDIYGNILKNVPASYYN